MFNLIYDPPPDMQEVNMSTRISARSRNLSYGWATQPVRRANGGAAIAEPTAPTEQGGPATLRRQFAALERAQLGGAWYRGRVFVGGVPIRETIGDVLLALDLGEALDATFISDRD